MSLHQQRTHPEFVEDCWACRVSTVQLNYQSLSTRDHVRNNIRRTERIIAHRQDKSEQLTDLRYGRRVDKATEDAVLAAPNFDGIRPKGVI